jgi:hypothetical protein
MSLIKLLNIGRKAMRSPSSSDAARFQEGVESALGVTPPRAPRTSPASKTLARIGQKGSGRGRSPRFPSEKLAEGTTFPLGDQRVGEELQSRIFQSKYPDPESGGDVVYRSDTSELSDYGEGGRVQGAGEYVSWNTQSKAAYREALPDAVHRKYRVDISDEYIGDWDAMLIDQPEVVQRAIYPIAKAMSMFKEGSITSITPKLKDRSEWIKSQGVRKHKELKDITGGEEGLDLSDVSEMDVAYPTKGQPDVTSLTFRGYLWDDTLGEVEVFLPDFSPKWNYDVNGWDTISHHQYDFTTGQWADKTTPLTDIHGGAKELGTIDNYKRWEETNPVRIRTEGDIEDRGLLWDWESGSMSDEDLPYFESLWKNVPLSFNVDMAELKDTVKGGDWLRGPVYARNPKDMRSFLYNELYDDLSNGMTRGIEDSINEGRVNLADYINPDLLTKERGRKVRDLAELGMLDPNIAESQYNFFIDGVGQEHATYALKRLGLGGHKFIDENLWMRSGDPYAAGRHEELPRGVKAKLESPMVDNYRQAVIYDKAFRTEMESAIADYRPWNVLKTLDPKTGLPKEFKKMTRKEAALREKKFKKGREKKKEDIESREEMKKMYAAQELRDREYDITDLFGRIRTPEELAEFNAVTDSIFENIAKDIDPLDFGEDTLIGRARNIPKGPLKTDPSFNR